MKTQTKQAQWKTWMASVAVTAVVSGCLVVAGTVGVAQAAEGHANSPNVQCVADVESVAAGGEIPFHLIYHNVENKNVSHVMLNVHVPEGLDVDLDGTDGEQWDAATRTLHWQLHDVKAGGAHVVHFQLKVKGDVKADTDFDFGCSYDEDGQVKGNVPNVKVHTGTELDQPFFVGYPDGKFHPDSYITRAEAAAVVARVKNLTNDHAPGLPYTDVPGGHWAYKYVNEVANAGYMVGYPDGSFHPDAPISRAELVRLVLSLRGVQPVPFDGYEDTNGHWAKDWIGTAKELGFVQGEGHGKFLPNGATQRDEAAKLFDVGLFRGPLKDGDVKVVQHFPDVPRTGWAFGWVEESAMVAHESEHRGVGIEQLIRYRPDVTEKM